MHIHLAGEKELGAVLLYILSNEKTSATVYRC